MTGFILKQTRQLTNREIKTLLKRFMITKVDDYHARAHINPDGKKIWYICQIKNNQISIGDHVELYDGVLVRGQVSIENNSSVMVADLYNCKIGENCQISGICSSLSYAEIPERTRFTIEVVI